MARVPEGPQHSVGSRQSRLVVGVLVPIASAPEGVEDDAHG